MKFSCERCGKRYATAEAPAAGRVYKIRCKACGHLIVVKGAVARSSPAVTSRSAASPAAAPALRSARPDGPAPELTPARLAAALARPDAPLAPPPPPADPESAFVDLFADLGPDDASSSGGAAAPDPFAPLREGLRTPPPEPVPRPAPPPVAVPVARRAEQRTGRGPVLLIGLGGLVLVGILAFVLLGGGGTSRPVAPLAAPQVQAQAPGAAPPRAPAPAPPAPPREAAPPERRPVREARPPQGVRQRKPEEPPAVAAAPGSRLTTAQISKVLAGSRKSFETCIAAAGRSGDVALDGRRVTLRLYVHADGSVAYPILDDPDLNASMLGSCLKSYARLLSFPKFQGETLLLEVPLLLASAR